MKHCGMDVHLRSTNVEIFDDQTGEVRRMQMRTEREALTKMLRQVGRMKVVLEASTVSHWIADLAEELGHEVVVVDPNRTKAVAVSGGYKKTDTLDAETLAWLSSKGAVVASHRPSKELRERRRRLVLRQRMVRSRGDLVRAVRSALAAQGVVVRGTTTKKFVAAVRALGDSVEAQSLEGPLRAIEVLEEQIATADQRLSKEAEGDEAVCRLMTVDGVGPVTASTFRVVVGDPKRFRSGREVAAYVGLVPTVHNSGQVKNRLGSISKHGDKMLRYLLVEAGHMLLRSRRCSDLQAWGMKVLARAGRKKATVALARKLCVVMWAMWKKETNFRRALPAVKAAA